MSGKNLRHLIKSREYQERGQVSGRSHLGLLEKKKDYKERTEDYHKKKKVIQTLTEKALTRNPDEFYFKMVNTKMVNGVHTEEEKVDPDKHEKIEKVRSDALTYASFASSLEKKKIQDLEASTHFLDNTIQNKVKRKHVIFTDTEEEAKNFSPAEYFNTLPELVDRSYNRLTKEQLSSGSIIVNKLAPGDMKRATKANIQSLKELRTRKERLAFLETQKDVLYRKKLLVNTKGKVKKIYTYDEFGDIIPSKTVYKWKIERK